jgi:hypothetical protein
VITVSSAYGTIPALRTVTPGEKYGLDVYVIWRGNKSNLELQEHA